MKKRCKQCTTVKDLGRFYADQRYSGGYMNVCKHCHKQNVSENRELKADYYREQKREISARPYYVQQRAVYNSSERGRQVNREANRRRRRFKAIELRRHDRNEVRQADSVHRQAVSPHSRLEITQRYGRGDWADSSRSGQDAARLQIQAGRER